MKQYALLAFLSPVASLLAVTGPATGYVKI